MSWWRSATVLFVGVYASPDSPVGKLVPASIDRLLNAEKAAARFPTSSASTRFDDSIGFIEERPVLGYGFQWVEASHNTVLQMLMAGGILALVGFFLVLIGYLKIGFGLRRAPDRREPGPFDRADHLGAHLRRLGRRSSTTSSSGTSTYRPA